MKGIQFLQSAALSVTCQPCARQKVWVSEWKGRHGKGRSFPTEASSQYFPDEQLHGLE